MGPGPVRLQAAVEAVVYTSAMTPLYITGTTQLYRICSAPYCAVSVRNTAHVLYDILYCNNSSHIGSCLQQQLVCSKAMSCYDPWLHACGSCPVSRLHAVLAAAPHMSTRLINLCLVCPAAADGSSVDSFYRELVWALLAVGQRSLALLVSRARYKVAPSAKAAGEGGIVRALN